MASNPLDYIKKANAPVKVNPLDFVSKKSVKTPKGYEITGAESAPATKVSEKVNSEVDAALKASGVIYEAEKQPSAFQRFTDWAGTTTSKIATKVPPSISKVASELSNIWKGGIQAAREKQGMSEEERTIFEGEQADSLLSGFSAFGKGAYDFLKQQIPSTIANSALAAAENPGAIKSVLAPLFKDPMGLSSPAGSLFDKGFDALANNAKVRETRGQIKNWADNVLAGLGEMQRERMTELGITDESSIFEPANFGYQLSSGATSMAAAIGVTYLTKNPTLAGAMLGWLEGSGTYSASKEKLKEEHPDWSEEKINSRSLANATIDSAGIAVLEKVGLDMLFRSYGGGRLSKAAINSITESMQETSQTVWSNAVAKYGYDKSRKIFDDVAETFIVTMPIGFFGGGAIPGQADTQILTEGGGLPTDEEDRKSSPAYVASLEKVAKENDISIEEAGAAAEAILPEIDKVVSQVGQVIGEQQKGAGALSQDIKEALDTRGEDQTLQDMVDNPTVPVATREEAKSAVDSALDIFASEDDEVMSAVRAAEEAVNGTVKKTKTPAITTKEEKTTVKKPDMAAIEKAVEETYQKATERKDDVTTPEGVAKDLIRGYVERGDTLQSLKAGLTGSYSEDYGAGIGGFIDGKNAGSDFIVVERIGKKEVKVKVSLKKTFDAIKAEMSTEKAQKVEGKVIDPYSKLNDAFGKIMDRIETDSFAQERIGDLQSRMRDMSLEDFTKELGDIIQNMEGDRFASEGLIEIFAKAKNGLTEKLTGEVAENGGDGIMEANGKRSKNSKRELPKRDVSKSGEEDEAGPEGDGGRSAVGGERMARGEDSVGGPSSGERSGTPLEEDATARIEATGFEKGDIEQIINTRTQRMEDGTITMEEPATEDELEVVSKFVPAGGRAKEGATGRGLLDEYYTPGDITLAVVTTLDNLGAFKDGMTILEPSVGTGNFLGDIEMIAAVDAYEINETAARIAKMSYPEANIINRPFESIFIDERGNKKTPKKTYDLVLGNPPYGEHRGKYKGLGEEPNIAKYEEYFLKRALNLTKEGGHVAMVIPSSFLRSGWSKTKEAISRLGVLEKAYRLPNGAFDTTDIGTDIVVFKRVAGNANGAPLFEDGYFKDNPDNILGLQTTRKGKFGEEPFVQGSLGEAIDSFYAIRDRELGETITEAPEIPVEELEAIGQEAENSYKPEVYKATRKGKKVKALEETKELAVMPDVKMGERLGVMVDIGMSGRQELAQYIETYKGQQILRDSMGQIVVHDPDRKTIFVVALDDGGGNKKFIPEANTVEDAKKYIDWLTKTKPRVYEQEKSTDVLDLATYSTADQEEANMWKFVSATGELEGNFPKDKAFLAGGKYFNKFNYLQGDIYEKLDQLEKDSPSLSTEQYERQKKALESVLPERVTVDRMNLPPNARFVTEFKIDGDDATLSEKFLSWVRKLPRSALGESSAYDIENYIDNVPVRGGDKLQNEKNRKTRRIEGDRLFKLFLKDELSAAEQAKIEEEYNRKFNSYARPNYREVPFVSKVAKIFNGMPLDIKEVQLQGVGFLVNKGVGLLAHDVGVGKTMQAILAMNETMKRGWAKRPLVVVPSVSVYNQWINEISQLIPDAKFTLLANLGADFKGDIKNLNIEEGTISIITEEGFKRLGFTSNTYDELTKDFHDVIENPDDSTARAKEKGKTKAEEEVGKGIRGTRADISFEDLGFDMIVGDEIHNANHIIAKAKMEEGSGKVSEFRSFQTKPSLYGIKMWLATQYILKRNNNRNVFLLSATPFTNNPLEYYSILSLMARERMKRMGIINVNDFMTAFMELTAENEVRADQSFKEKNEVRSFKNYQQFRKLLTEFIDFRDGEEAGVKRPARVGKEYIVGETVQAMQFKDAAQDLFKDKDAGTLKAINELRTIAFSPFLSRYYKEGVPSPQQFIDGSPKIKAAVELIKQSLKDNPEAGQLVYSTIGVEYFPLIREHLISELGLSESEVQIISGATPKNKRSAIQENFNNGSVKVVLGSDAIQEGVNLQKNSTDLYILSLPWNFTSLRQVIGRIWRQGNKWPRVRVNYLFTENSIDVFLSQKLQNKEKRYEEAQKFMGDTLDVGDVDYEELKFDLITDPVVRTEMEYQQKEAKLKHEILTIRSERAYKNRKAENYIDLKEKTQSYKELAEENPDNDWWKQSQINFEEKLKKEAASLRERGFDLENLEKDLAETDAKIAELEKNIETLDTEKQAALEKSRKERVDSVSNRETDFGKFIGEREEENATFYDREAPMFERVTEPAYSGKKVEELPDIGITDEEREAVMAFYAQGGRMTSEIKPLVDSAVKKYLDYMGQAQKEANEAFFEVMPDASNALDRASNELGMPFDMTQFDAKEFVKALFGSDVSLIFRDDFIDSDNEKNKSWGQYQPASSWRNPLIRLVTNRGMVQTEVAYHEAFHAFLDNQMAKSEVKALLEKVAKNPATLPARVASKIAGYEFSETAEEWLAEDFARYAAKQQHMTANDSLYSSWIEKIRGWVRKTTGAEMVYNRMLAQLPKPTIQIKAVSREQAKEALLEYQKRLGVKFDIDFANVIFTGEYTKDGKPVQARAVTYNNSITLSENLRELTAHHEVAHLIAHNIEQIPAFAGMTEKEILKAVNGGRDYTSNDINGLHEKLAIGFENYLEGRREKQATILGRFYQTLLDLLNELYAALGGDINPVQEFYRKLATAKGEGEVVLVSEKAASEEIQRFSRGDLIVDFGMREKKAFVDSVRRKFFDELKSEVPFGDASENLIRKDINALENYLSQARDIYLKDPNEFGAAKSFENVGDQRRLKKQALDLKFSKMLESYLKLKGGNMERVNQVLMKGDQKGVEYDEQDLKNFGLGQIEIDGYKAVRKAFNIGHQLLLTEMAERGVKPEELAEYEKTRVGYMPHKWPHKYVVKSQELEKKGAEENWKTKEMTSYSTEKKAKEAYEKMRSENAGNDTRRFVLDTLDNLEVDFFSQQGLSFEALKSVVQQARTGNDIKDKMLEAVRNMFKEKGFGRNFLYRTGVQGYETKEMPKLVVGYFAGLDGFLTKMEAAKKYYDVLSTVDARRQSQFYSWLRDSISYDLGHTKEWTRVKQAAFLYYLANDISFLLVNATQNFTVGMGELSKYTKGDLLKPERMIMKAMTDYWTGNIIPDERQVIEGLVALGALGGEQVAEMMNIKNNPLYTEISGRFNKIMYSSTTFVERAINRVPAFLAARRLFIEQGMGPKEANEKALEVADDIHFRYGKQHRPRFERGRIGTLFVFTHYTRSILFQLYRNLKAKEFAVFARKMIYTAALGGALSLPFARTLTSIFKSIFGAGGDDEEEEEMGKWEIMLQHGLPAALAGIDLSGRVGIDILSVNTILEDPDSVKNYLGVVGSLIWYSPDPDKSGRLVQALELARQGRLEDAAGRALPDMFGNLVKSYTGYKWGVRSFAGTPLENADGEVYKYNTWEAIVKATGFSPTQETLLWNAKSDEWLTADEEQEKRTRLRREIQMEVQKGNFEEARKLQDEARAAEIISETTDYVRQFGKDTFFDNAIKAIEAGEAVKTVEKELIEQIYGADPSDAQKNNARKDLAVFRSYGTQNKYVNDLMGASTNKEKVEVLKKAKEELGDEAFKDFLRKGRKTISTESGNPSRILISDDLNSMFNASKND